LEKDKKALETHYGITFENDEPLDIIEQIGKRRGFLKKGGIVDDLKTAMTIVRDWQIGKLRL